MSLKNIFTRDEPTDEDSGSDTDLSLEQLAEVLKSERRRLVIRQLQDVDGQITLSDLVEQVTAIRAGEDWSYSERKAEWVALYQSHLPRLDDYDVVEFNSDRNIVQCGPEFSAARLTLDAVEEVVA